MWSVCPCACVSACFCLCGHLFICPAGKGPRSPSLPFAHHRGRAFTLPWALQPEARSTFLPLSCAHLVTKHLGICPPTEFPLLFPSVLPCPSQLTAQPSPPHSNTPGHSALPGAPQGFLLRITQAPPSGPNEAEPTMCAGRSPRIPQPRGRLLHLRPLPLPVNPSGWSHPLSESSLPQTKGTEHNPALVSTPCLPPGQPSPQYLPWTSAHCQGPLGSLSKLGA